MSEKDPKQKLINICFELVITAHTWKDFHKKDREEIGEWVANQLSQCGFPTHPIGSSWGVLIEDPELLDKLRKGTKREDWKKY